MNILLIVIDGLRADRLSCMGCTRPTSPAIDAIARDGILFEHCFTPVTPTQPAMTTLLTGQFPLTHMIVAQSGYNTLDPHAPWLPTLLKRNGYATIAVDSLASEKRWFSRGIGTSIDPEAIYDTPHTCLQLNRLAVGCLKEQRSPFFMLLHYYETHTPYVPDERHIRRFYDGNPTVTNRGSLAPFYRRPLKPQLVTDWLLPYARQWDVNGQIEDIEFVRALYDAAICMADEGINELMEQLRLLGILDDTAVFILGDHGQELGEHGIYFEQHGLYDTTLRVPFIVRTPAPDARGRRITSVVQLPDIAPTILDIAGVGIPDSVEGRSLAPFLTGTEDPPGYNAVLACESTWMSKWAYRTPTHKLIVSRSRDFYGKPGTELYDLKNDPAEQSNLADAKPELCARLREQMEQSIARHLRPGREDPIAVHGIVRGLHSYHITKTLEELRPSPFGGFASRTRPSPGTTPLPDVHPSLREWAYPEFRSMLESLRPEIGAHEWWLGFLRRAAQEQGLFPDALYQVFRRFTRRRPRRPYFVGVTTDEILFLGDLRDPFSVASAVVRGFNGTVTGFLADEVRRNPGSFIDAGANAGITAATVARELRGVATVYAFEPLPEAAARAAATFALNRLTNVRLYCCAVGESDGATRLLHAPGRSTIASTHRTRLLSEHRLIAEIPVPRRSLDSLRKEFCWGPVSLIKIDVEGSEAEVLKGAEALLRTDRPGILYERNPQTMPDRDVDKAIASIIPSDYRVEGLMADGSLQPIDPGCSEQPYDVWCTPDGRDEAGIPR